MVQLMMVGGDKAKTMIIGKGFARSVGGAWPFFASCLGALGTFFAGSATNSNLTFGGIQDSIARSLELDRTSILALQSVGGAMGDMVCVNNITAVESIIGLVNQEGFILKRTIILVLL
jgi:lactate permease